MSAGLGVMVGELEGMHARRRRGAWPPFLVALGTKEEVRPQTYALFEEEEEEEKEEKKRLVVARNEDAEAEGPWELDATVRGGKDTPYDRDIHVTLTFPGDYPNRPPRVRVRGIVSHVFLNDFNEPFPVFYNPINYAPDDQDGTYDIPTCLLAVSQLFTKPLAFPSGTMVEAQEAELARQWQLAAEHDAERHALIAKYRPMAKHGELFDVADGAELPKAWFDPAFVAAVLEDGSPESVRAFVRKECDGAYSFPLFAPTFCTMLIEESEHYQKSGLPVRRPNSMNAYGLILNEIGLEQLMDKFQQRCFLPVARALFDPSVSCRFDAHHSFLVHYQLGADLGLDMHTDDSDVTFNACLGKEFEGAGLSICGVMGEGNDMRKLRHVYTHVVGRCLVHLGRHRHGADDITKGERLNLICWNHNVLWRKSTPYQKLHLAEEEGPPDAKCLSFTHDRDHPNAGPRAWYPPKRS